MQSPRVYRHRPWLVLSAAAMLLFAGLIVPLVVRAARSPGIETIAEAALLLTPLAAVEAFLVFSWRIRTVVDDSGITQHWIRRSYRIPFAEVTGVERERAFDRWFLRVHCGEHTFEAIPCQTLIAYGSSNALRPPRAMQAAEADIDRSRVRHEAARVAGGRPGPPG